MSFLRCNELFLRSIEPSDLEVLLEIENDTKEWIHSETYLPFSKSTMELYVKGEHDLITHGQHRFMIISEKAEAAVGAIDLFNYSAIHSRAGVGVYILERHRSKRLATKALNLICEYASQVLNIELLYCSVLASNEKSLKLFASAGFINTGSRPKWSKVAGKREDVILLQRELTSIINP
ncbi:MAG: GNAT family N-acetyltransferase [Flavobacteriales bacterium]